MEYYLHREIQRVWTLTNALSFYFLGICNLETLCSKPTTGDNLRWTRPVCTIGIRTKSKTRSVMYLVQIPEDFVRDSEGQSMKKLFGITHWERNSGKNDDWTRRMMWPLWQGNECSFVRSFVRRSVAKTCRNLVRSRRSFRA